MIYSDTSIGFLYPRSFRVCCVAITLSFVQMAALGLYKISKTKFRRLLRNKDNCHQRKNPLLIVALVIDVINTILFKMHNLKITFFTIGLTLWKRLTGYSYASVKAALVSERTRE